VTAILRELTLSSVGVGEFANTGGVVGVGRGEVVWGKEGTVAGSEGKFSLVGRVVGVGMMRVGVAVAVTIGVAVGSGVKVGASVSVGVAVLKSANLTRVVCLLGCSVWLKGRVQARIEKVIKSTSGCSLRTKLLLKDR
jgi:hypothetical protein